MRSKALHFALSLALVVAGLLAPERAIAQLAPGCYSGDIGNGAANGNVIASLTTNSNTSLTVTSGCTPVLTIGPTLAAADITSIGTSAAPIAAAYISSLAAATYNFPSSSVLTGMDLGGESVAGITGTPTAFTASQAIYGVNTGTSITGIGASLAIGPSTAAGTSGNSQNLYFIANTATATTVDAPYIYGSSSGALEFKVQSPQGIYTNGAPLIVGNNYISYAIEHGNAACGGISGLTDTATPLASGTSGSPIALGTQGPNCVGTMNGSGHAYYTFSSANLNYPCITGAEETTGTNNGFITYALSQSGTTYTVTFSSSNASDGNVFAFHLAGCPN